MRLIREFFSPFAWRMALRDARPQWKSLLLYTSSVIAGVAALVAILSFRNDVFMTIDEQSRELLGADIEFRATQPFADPVLAFLDSLQAERSTTIEFNSMVQFSSTGDTRLSQVRALDGNFPYYGTIGTIPEDAASTFQDEHFALVEQSTMRQFNQSVGDSIRIGETTLVIGGELLSVPGESAAFSLIGPRVYVPQSVVEGTALLQRGSRVEYKEYLLLEEPGRAGTIVREFRPLGREHSVRTETVESRKQTFDAIVSNLSRFLGLIAFIALLLGGLGVGSAVYVYIKRKTASIAALRCLGMSTEQVLAIFSIQIALVGLAGAVAGTSLGVFIQLYLPTLFADFLPFEIVQGLSLQAVFLGLFIGLFISIGFSLLPLLAVSGISPMRTLRSGDSSPLQHLSTRAKAGAVIASATILIAMVALVTEGITTALLFAAGVLFSVGILWGTAKLLIRSLRTLRLKSSPYIWRQGIANLFRPNNQTPILVTTLGMGMLLIGTLYLSQEMLLNRIDLQSEQELPSVVFYDVQSDQNEGVNRLIEDNGGTIMQNVPIVSMRLSQWNGRSVADVRADTARTISRWALTREYRVTYREELVSSETILEGEWIGTSDGIGSVVPISIATQIRDDLQVGVGDSLTFNVQGVPVETVVASIREVDFQRPEPNFFVLFPSGVLEEAPQFFATIVRTSGDDTAMAIQREVVSNYPTVSAIDISIALQSVQEFMDKISLAIQFMALFSIFTGFIVLISSMAISRKQRTRESVLLRTLGAVKRQVANVFTIEYALLGVLASLTGILLALIMSWILAYTYFDLVFVPDTPALLFFALGIIVLTVAIGWSGSRHIFKRTPNEILRSEEISSA
ncbi:MAG: ABC transporter permease [Balneolaceae bacterium]